jgi:hypothetical protein
MLGGFPEAAAEQGLGVSLDKAAHAIEKALGPTVNADMVPLLARGMVSSLPGDGTFASEIAGAVATYISTIDDNDDELGLATGITRRAKVVGAYSALTAAARELTLASPDFDDPQELAIRLMVGLLATPVLYTVEGDVLAITTALFTALKDAATSLLGLEGDDSPVTANDAIGLLQLIGVK